jgi:outer membrane murein-binding lipoprotein Lpp
MRHLVIIPLLLLAACDDAPKVDKRAGEAKQLTAGGYAVEAKVETMTATDKGPPASKAKPGDIIKLAGCVAADGTPDASLFVHAGDQCRAMQSYTRGALLNIQYNCTRKGGAGSVNYSVDGQFTADAFTAKVTEGTSFTTPDDYVLVASVTGKKMGVCPAPVPAKKG